MVSEAFAMGNAAANQQGGQAGYEGLLMLVIMFGIFYFLLIRPQQKRAKEHKAMVENLKIGDQVLTAGGIYGKIAALQEDSVSLEIAAGVKVKITRSSVISVTKE